MSQTEIVDYSIEITKLIVMVKAQQIQIDNLQKAIDRMLPKGAYAGWPTPARELPVEDRYWLDVACEYNSR